MELSSRATSACLLSCLLVVSLTCVGTGQQDGQEFSIGTWRSLESKVLGETRPLIVGLPASYESETEKSYPVLYLLDGPAHFHHTSGLVEFLSSTRMIPEMIVVAVANTNRARDMMPKNVNPPDPKFPWENGGADNFIRFFAEELIPYVDAHYRTHDYRVLIGHSMGGLFAIYTLTKQPDVFDAYIAISPSLLFDQQSLVEQADKYFRETETLKKTLYMTTGNEGMGVTGGVLKLAGILTEHQPAGFEWDSCIMSEETHISVVHRSTRQGLEFVFKHWAMRNPLEVYDIGGLEGILAFSNKAQNRYGINPNATEQQLNGLIHKLIQDNRLDEARAVIEHDPKEFTPWPWVFLELGQEYKDLGDTDQAIKYLTRANELNPRDKGVQQLLAELGVDPSNFAKVIEVSPEELAIYVGCYGPDSNGGELKVELNEGKLNVTFGEKTEAPFSPGPDRHFYSGSQELVFTTDDGGAVIRVEVLVGGKVVASLPRK